MFQTRVLAAMGRHFQARHNSARMEDLPDNILRDVGLTRSHIRFASRHPLRRHVE